MEFLHKVLPIVLMFVLGFILKLSKLFGKDTADTFLKFIFYVSMPALVFRSVSILQLSTKFIFLPVIAAFVFFVVFFLALVIGKKQNFPPKTLGTFLLGTMIMNTGFVMPFIYSVYGIKGIAMITIFDFGNAILVFSFGYFIAMRYGNSDRNNKTVNWKKLITLPPIWGLVLGLAVNLLELELPAAFGNFLEQIGVLTLPLIMLSIGIYFSPRVKKFPRILLALFLRTGIGLLLAFVFVTALKLEGMLKVIIIVCAGSPTGYNTLVFSTLEKLDKEFAANLVSISILLGLIYIPVLIYLVK